MAFEQLDDIYREIILDHRRHPRNRNPLERADISADGLNPFCGDEIHLQIALADDGPVSKIGLQVVGCSINQAAGSMLTEAIEGKTLSEIDAVSALFQSLMAGDSLAEEDRERLGDLQELEGVRQFPVRIKCALLAWSTLQDAIDDYRRRLPK